GHVSRVAQVGMQQESGSGSVVVYQTTVAIDERLEGLKPDMSAEVTILADDTAETTVLAPLHAVVPARQRRGHGICFVQTPEGPEERDVLVGRFDERMIEVRSGLEDGDELLLDPRP